MESESDVSFIGEAVWSNWTPPRKAVLTVAQFISGSQEKAVAWLRRRLDFGQLEASAGSLFYIHKGSCRDGEFCKIPTTLWPEALGIASDDDFWISGDFAKTPNSSLDRALNEFSCVITGARFDTEQLMQLVRELEQDSITPSDQHTHDESKIASRRLGGRPQKPFWDELWASVGAQLYNGDLKPERQADIERSMHDWLAANDEIAGETAVRTRAKLLWAGIQKEVEN